MRVPVWLAVVVLAAFCLADDPPTGARVQGSQKALDFLLSVGVPIIEAKIATVQIPGMSGRKDDFDYSIDNIHVTKCDLSGLSIGIVAGQSALIVNANNLDVRVTGSWSYREHTIHFPFGSGTFEAGVLGSTHLSQTIQMVVNNGRIGCAHGPTSVHIDDLSISIHGSILSWLYDIVIDTFKSLLKHELDSVITQQAQSFLDNEANALLQDIDLVIDLPFPAPYDQFTVDLSVLGFNSTSLVFTANSRGLMYDANDQSCPLQPPPMAYLDPAVVESRMVSMTLSPYLINTGLWAAHTHDLLSAIVSPASLPPALPNFLTTQYFAAIAPGLLLKYGKANMTLGIATFAVPTLDVNASALDAGAVLTAPADFSFNVSASSGSVPAFALSCPVRLAFDAEVDSGVVHPHLDYLSCDLTVKSTEVGPILVGALQSALELIIKDVLLPAVNKVIAPGMPLPTVDGLSFNNSSIHSTTDANFLVQTDFSYKPPVGRVAEAARTLEGALLDSNAHRKYTKELRVKLDLKPNLAALIPHA